MGRIKYFPHALYPFPPAISPMPHALCPMQTHSLFKLLTGFINAALIP